MNDPFSDLLTEATGMAGCPVCRVLTRLLYDEMCRLQYDGVHDPATRARLRAGGFCADHLWYLFDLTTRRAVAALLAPCAEQVRALAARLEADAAPTLRRGEAALVRPLGTAECIACSHLRAWSDVLADTTAALLSRGSVPVAATALCVAHLGLVAGRLPTAAASALLDAWAHATRELVARLDVAAGERGLGRERHVAAEAVRRLAGGRSLGQC